MKVPLYEQQVAPQSVGLPVASPRAVDDSGLRAGLASLDRAGSVVIAKQREAEEKAIAAEVTERETALTRGITEDLHGSQSTEGMAPGRQEGFLSLKGRNAEESSVHFMERIEKRRQALADSLKDERAKKLFLARTNGDIENARRTVESHTAQQRQLADVATVKARQDAALEAVRANPNNISEVERQTVALEGPISALGLSPEDREADIKRWHAEVAANQVAAQLERGDWQSAEATLKNKGAMLPRAVAKQLDSQVDRLKVDATAEGFAAGIAKAATDPTNGRIDDVKAYELLDSADIPDEAKKAARERLNRRITDNARAWTQNVEKHYHAAFSVYLRSRNLDNVPNSVRNWLIDNASEKWDELEQKQVRDRNQARKVRAERESPAEARALIELKSDIVRNPDKYAEMTPDQFDLEWGAKLSQSGYKEGGTLFANTAKGDRLADGEFSGYVNELVRTTPLFQVENPGNRAEVEEKKQLANGFRADFGEARRAFKDEKKRNPSMSEVQSPEFQKRIWLNMYRRVGIKLPETAPEEMIRVKSKETGATGTMPASKFNPDKYEREGG